MAKLIACAGQGVELSGVPTEIKILPLGRVHSQKGDFNVDDESFELIRKQFKDRKLDLVIDYEHQTLSDVQAPAGGWIKDLYKGEDAIIAKVEWTPKAAEYLKNKEYRYLSPVVLVRKRDQKATAIHSVALTNTPAIDGMFALVNSLDIEDISEGGNIMDLKELAKALGLPETATEEEIKKAVEDAAKAAEKLKEMDGKKPGEGDGKPGDGEPKPEGADMVANSTILSMLGLKADAKTEDVAASIMALKAGAPDTQAELLLMQITGANDVDIMLDEDGQPVSDGNGDTALVSDDECWLQDIKNEAMTEEGELFYEDEEGDASYGWSLLDFMQGEYDDFTQMEIQQRIRSKMSKRDYIDAGSIQTTVNFDGHIYHIRIAFRRTDSNSEYNIDIESNGVEVIVE